MTEKVKILVVEDEAATALMLERMLSDMGYSITGVTATAEGAVSLARSGAPDIVLMDVRLRGEQDGISAATKIREFSDVPIIFLTAYTDHETISRACATGPFGYLVKPFHPSELRSSIEISLVKYRSELALREANELLEKKVAERTEELSRTIKELELEVWERRNLQQRHEEKTAQQNAILENTLAGIAFLKDRRFVWLNSKMEDMFGYHRDEVIGLTTESFYPSREDYEQFGRQAYPLLSHGRTYADERLMRRKDGTEFWCSLSGTAIEPSDLSKGSIWILQDISDRKRADEDLEHYKTHLESLVEERTAELRRAVDELTYRQCEINALLESSRAALEHREFAGSARLIYDHCKKMIGTTAGYVAFLSEDGTQNEVLYLDPGGLSCTVDPALPMPVRGLRADAYLSGLPVYHNDFKKSKWMDLLPQGHVVLDNIMIAPLVMGGKSVGIMGFANKPGGFSPEDANIAMAFCDIAVIAYNNSRMNNELEEGEKRYKVLVESVTDYIYSVTVDNGYVTGTKHGPGCIAVTGYTPEEFDSDPNLWFTIVYEDDRDSVLEQANRILAQLTVGPLEHRIVHKDGSIKWVRNTEVPRYDERGILTAYDGLIQDITERKNSEEERERLLAELNKTLEIVSRSQKEWRETFDSITDQISIIDKDFTIIRANRAYTEHFGLDPREVAGKKCHELVHGCELPVDNCPHMVTRQDMTSTTREIIDPKTRRTFRVSTYPYYSPLNDYIGSIHISKDITDEKEKEAQFLRSERLASLGELSAGMAHEINNPVSFIMANSQLLSEIWKDVLKILHRHMEEDGDFEVGGFSFSKTHERITRLFSGISEGARRIKDIVDNLKVFTHSKTIEHLEPVNIEMVIRVSLDILEDQIEKFTDRFAADIEDGMPEVMGNSHSIEQVISNLVMNALQALPERSRGVFLSARQDRDDGCVVIRITDEGVGMSRDVLEKAYTPFFTTKRDCGGIGLGLSISRSIIDDHGGSLEFDSEPGKGTVATVRLPVLSAELCRGGQI